MENVVSKPKVLLWELFWEMLKLSAFTFGGGYVIVAMMQSQFVEEKHWLNEDEMLNLTAVAQAAPGIVAVNAAIAVGYSLRRVPGILISALATILPPFCIILMICPIYTWFSDQPWIKWLMAGMNVSVCAVIAGSVLQMGKSSLQKNTIRNLIVIVSVFVLSAFLSVNVIWIILFCLAAGGLEALVQYFRGKSGKNKKDAVSKDSESDSDEPSGNSGKGSDRS